MNRYIIPGLAAAVVIYLLSQLSPSYLGKRITQGIKINQARQVCLDEFQEAYKAPTPKQVKDLRLQICDYIKKPVSCKPTQVEIEQWLMNYLLECAQKTEKTFL